MTDIMWEEPIDASDNDEGLEHLPAALMQRPGAWARIATRPTSPKAATLVTRVKGGKGVWGVGIFDATQRKINDEQAIYARFVRAKEDTGEQPPTDD